MSKIKKEEKREILIDEITFSELKLSLAETEKAKQNFLRWRDELAKSEEQMKSKLRMLFAINKKEYPKDGNIELSQDGKKITY